MNPYLQGFLIAVGVVAVLCIIVFAGAVWLAKDEPWSET